MKAMAVLVAVLVALTAIAHAAPSSQENLARSHYVAGEEEYARGRWQEALHEFQIGYSLSPRPEFLINFAQVYRKLGDYDRAITECERYLATGPEASLAAQAQRLLQQLREEKQHAAPTRVAPAVTPPTNNAMNNAPNSATSNATNNVSQPPLALTAPPTPPAKRSRRWIAPVVTVGAVLVAAGIVVGIVLGTQPRDTFKPAPLGTVDFR